MPMSLWRKNTALNVKISMYVNGLDDPRSKIVCFVQNGTVCHECSGMQTDERRMAFQKSQSEMT